VQLCGTVNSFLRYCKAVVITNKTLKVAAESLEDGDINGIAVWLNAVATMLYKCYINMTWSHSLHHKFQIGFINGGLYLGGFCPGGLWFGDFC